MRQSIFMLSETEKVQVQSLKVKPDLNAKIWDRDDEYKIYPEVRRKLLDVARYFAEFCELDELGVNAHVTDIILTGSIANYNWSMYSDIDVHVVMDFSGVEDRARAILVQYLDLKKKQFAEQHDITVASHEVEMYVQDSSAELVALGVYSLTDDKWLKFPKKYEEQIEWDLVKKKAASYMNAIDDAWKAVNFGSVKSPDALMSGLTSLWKKIKSDRRAGLEESGEFSVENLVFKVLRRNGYISKLLDLRSRMVSQKLSLK